MGLFVIGNSKRNRTVKTVEHANRADFTHGFEVRSTHLDSVIFGYRMKSTAHCIPQSFDKFGQSSTWPENKKQGVPRSENSLSFP